MATLQPEWEPTAQDLDLYRDTLSERRKALAKNEDTYLSIDRYEEIWPLWMWKKAVEQRDQFVTEFLPHLSTWWRMVHRNASVSTDNDPAFKAFCVTLFLRWQWCYFQLIVATAGMPQPLRRRIRLCDLSIAEQQAIRIAVDRAFHSGASRRLKPSDWFDPRTPLR